MLNGDGAGAAEAESAASHVTSRAMVIERFTTSAIHIINIETMPPEQIIAEKQEIVSCRHLTGSRMGGE
jgi:hypothetical protein